MYSIAAFLGAAVVTAGIFFTGILFDQQSYNDNAAATQPSFGSTFSPAQIPQTTLSGAGITSSQSTIQLVTFLTRDGRAVAMSNLGSIGYGTLEPGSSKEEIVSFTGITQNVNGTATLTGVSRGLDFLSPYAASTTLQKSHAGGAVFIMSNTAPFYGQQFALVNNTASIGAVWTFGSTSPPLYDFNPNFSALASTTLVSKGYVDSIAIAGAVPITTANAGIGLLASAREAASSTATGVFNAITYNKILASSYATDTPQNCSTPGTGGCVVMSLLNGKLNQSWLDLTQAFSFSGLLTFTGGFLDTASSTHTATTSIAASNTISNALVLNNLAYAFPSVRGASSTQLTENGSGKLTFVTPEIQIIKAAGFANKTTTSGSTSTLDTIAIPANTLNANNYLEVSSIISMSESANKCYSQLDIGTGLATTTLGSSPGGFMMEQTATIGATSTTQGYSFYKATSDSTGAANGALLTGQNFYVQRTLLALNSAAIIYIDIRALSTGGSNCILDKEDVRVVQNTM